MDNLPNTVIEAQSCGTPVVAFDVGGLPDIIVHNQTGYLAKAFDTDDLAEGIIHTLNSSEYNLYCNQCRDSAIRKFSLSVIAKQYLDVLEKYWIPVLNSESNELHKCLDNCNNF